MLEGLIAHMRQAARDLSFADVFLEEAEAAAKAAATELGAEPAA
jgi:hypothetical protein